jgi:uncharacterized membrane protein
MDFKKHLEIGWQNTLKFIGPVILLTFIQVLVSIFSLGILAPVTTAGYMKSLLLAAREGRTPDIKDLFSEMSLFLPLLGFAFVIVIAIGIGFMFLILPGFILMIAFLFASLYMLPLMVDRRLGVIDALKASWEMANRNPIADQAIITIIYAALFSIGGSLGGLGILVTQPLATFVLLSVYQERLITSPGLGKAQSAPPPPPVH